MKPSSESVPGAQAPALLAFGPDELVRCPGRRRRKGDPHERPCGSVIAGRLLPGTLAVAGLTRRLPARPECPLSVVVDCRHCGAAVRVILFHLADGFPDWVRAALEPDAPLQTSANPSPNVAPSARSP